MRWVNEIFPDLPAAWSPLIEPLASLLQHADRQHAEGRGGGDRQALVHVGDELGGGALDGGGTRLAGRGAAGSAGAGMAAATAARGSAVRAGAGCARRPVAVRALADDAALEQPAPLRPDRGRVPEELLVHGLGEAGVGRLEHVRIHEAHRMSLRCARSRTARSPHRARVKIMAPPGHAPGGGSRRPLAAGEGLVALRFGRDPLARPSACSRAISSATRRAAATPRSGSRSTGEAAHHDVLDGLGQLPPDRVHHFGLDRGMRRQEPAEQAAFARAEIVDAGGLGAVVSEQVLDAVRRTPSSSPRSRNGPGRRPRRRAAALRRCAASAAPRAAVPEPELAAPRDRRPPSPSTR